MPELSVLCGALFLGNQEGDPELALRGECAVPFLLTPPSPVLRLQETPISHLV